LCGSSKVKACLRLADSCNVGALCALLDVQLLVSCNYKLFTLLLLAQRNCAVLCEANNASVEINRVVKGKVLLFFSTKAQLFALFVSKRAIR
jgi:hypothetical protein